MQIFERKRERIEKNKVNLQEKKEYGRNIFYGRN